MNPLFNTLMHELHNINLKMDALTRDFERLEQKLEKLSEQKASDENALDKKEDSVNTFPLVLIGFVIVAIVLYVIGVVLCSIK